MKPLIIAFAGPQRVGKDTAAKHLQQIFGGPIVKFADPLKKMASDLFGRDYFDEATKLLYRSDLQDLGMAVRAIDPNAWINLAIKDIRKKLECARIVYVTDMRFRNECEAIDSIGGYTVLIRRPTGIIDAHQSEQECLTLPTDYVIDNNGTLVEFKDTVDHLMELICEAAH